VRYPWRLFCRDRSSGAHPSAFLTLEPGPPESDSLAVKRELENQDGAGAQEMFEVLDAINRGQSQLPPSHFRPPLPFFTSRHTGAPGDDDPTTSKIKRDLENTEPNNPSSSSHQTGSRSRTSAPNRGRDHEHDYRRDRRGSYSPSTSVQGRDERGGGRERDREWRDGERDRQPGDRKRSFEHRDGRRYEDRGSNGRGECKPHSLNSVLLDPVVFSSSLHFRSYRFLPPLPPRVDRGHRTLRLRYSYRPAPSHSLSGDALTTCLCFL